MKGSGMVSVQAVRICRPTTGRSPCWPATPARYRSPRWSPTPSPSLMPRSPSRPRWMPAPPPRSSSRTHPAWPKVSAHRPGPDTLTTLYTDSGMNTFVLWPLTTIVLTAASAQRTVSRIRQGFTVDILVGSFYRYPPAPCRELRAVAMLAAFPENVLLDTPQLELLRRS